MQAKATFAGIHVPHAFFCKKGMKTFCRYGFSVGAQRIKDDKEVFVYSLACSADS
jgi:hypothetical protein